MIPAFFVLFGIYDLIADTKYHFSNRGQLRACFKTMSISFKIITFINIKKYKDY